MSLDSVQGIVEVNAQVNIQIHSCSWLLSESSLRSRSGGPDPLGVSRRLLDVVHFRGIVLDIASTTPDFTGLRPVQRPGQLRGPGQLMTPLSAPVTSRRSRSPRRKVTPPRRYRSPFRRSRLPVKSCRRFRSPRSRSPSSRRCPLQGHRP